jgi:hypothetical protein
LAKIPAGIVSARSVTGSNCSINSAPKLAAVNTRNPATRAGVFVSRNA